jgi:hypothetical protein
MNGKFFGVAIVLTVIAIAGFVIWYNNSGRASSGGAVNLMLAYHAFLIGIVALITGIVAWYTALRSPSQEELRKSVVATDATGRVDSV